MSSSVPNLLVTSKSVQGSNVTNQVFWMIVRGSESLLSSASY